MTVALQRAMQQHSVSASRIEALAKRLWKPGDSIAWTARGYGQRGVVLENLTFGDHIRIRCRNDGTEKVVDVRYSTYSGLYA